MSIPENQKRTKAMSTRKSYSMAFQRDILIKLEENGGNVIRTEKESDVKRSNIIRWHSQQAEIMVASRPKT